jgi:hypothetical protein
MGEFKTYTNVGVTVGVSVGVGVTVGVSEGVGLAGNQKAVCVCAISAVPAMTVSISPGAEVGYVDAEGSADPTPQLSATIASNPANCANTRLRFVWSSQTAPRG